MVPVGDGVFLGVLCGNPEQCDILLVHVRAPAVAMVAVHPLPPVHWAIGDDRLLDSLGWPATEGMDVNLVIFWGVM